MLFKKILLLFVGIGLLLCHIDANAITIDFNNLLFEDSSFHFVSSPYTEDGFVLYRDDVSPTNNFCVRGSLSAVYKGSPSMVINGNIFNGFPEAFLEKQDGGYFDLLSINLALEDIFQTYVSTNITFIGEKAEGGTITQSFTLTTPSNVLQTFFFNDFFNLKSIRWMQSEYIHTFDDIVVRNTTNPVPEPSSMLLFGTGLVGVFGYMRGKRKV